MVVVDTEYTGHEANIKSMILRHCHRVGLRLSPHQLRFDQIGKSSGAHKLAHEIQRGKVSANRQIRLQEILALMQ